MQRQGRIIALLISKLAVDTHHGTSVKETLCSCDRPPINIDIPPCFMFFPSMIEGTMLLFDIDEHLREYRRKEGYSPHTEPCITLCSNPHRPQS